LPAPERVTPIPAGSVNSNFFLEASGKRWFFRIYEEQGVEGVAYEWALLDHLARSGLEVPRRIAGPPPGSVLVAEKPVAVFEVVSGHETCQAGVSPARAGAVGAFLARAHLASDDFPHRRQGRFTLDAIRARVEGVSTEETEVRTALAAVRSALDEAAAGLSADLPTGVIHGDLFRDNVRFEGDRIVAALDWESASDGPRIYDLAVTVLAWCWGDTMDVSLARALVEGYRGERPLADVERESFRAAALAAAARFTATRITDYHLRRGGVGERVHKDYRRFLARLEWVRERSPSEISGSFF
jgi:homoserine kinase type II